MKLVYVGLRMNREFQNALKQEKAAFWKSFHYLEVLRNFLNYWNHKSVTNLDDARGYVQNMIQVFAQAGPDPDCRLTKGKLEQLLERMSHYTAESLMQVRILIELELQNYWLAWKEDFICRRLEESCSHAVQTVLHDRRERAYKGTYLMVAALPEFFFCNDLEQEYTPFFTEHPMGQLPFYQQIALQFSQGLLADDNPGCADGHPRKISRMQFQSGSRFQLVVFAGTIIWQTGPLGKERIYNTAYVFSNSQLVFAWDKQLVSEVDGASNESAWKRVETISDDMEHLLQSEHYSAAEMTSVLVKEPNPAQLRPVFPVTVFGKRIEFALTICREMVRDDLLGTLNCDIHIVLAAGISAPAHIPYICAERAFLYCDVCQFMVGPCAAAIQLGEDGYWSQPERKAGNCRWDALTYEIIMEQWQRKGAVSMDEEEPFLLWPVYMELGD